MKQPLLVLVLLLLLGGLAACTVPNPAFDPGGADLGEPVDLGGPPDSGLSPDGGPGPLGVRFVVELATPGAELLEDQPFTLQVQALDAQGRPEPDYAGVLLLHATWGDVFPRSVQVTQVDAQGRVRFPVRLDREGAAVIVVEDHARVGETRPLTVRHGTWNGGRAPSFTGGAPGNWDEYDVNMPEVRLVGGKLLLLYRGRSYQGLPARLVGGIGRADSSNGGVTWLRHGPDPLLVDETAAADFFSLGAPTLVVAGSRWDLWLTVTPRGDSYIGHLGGTAAGPWEPLPPELTLVSAQTGLPGAREIRDPCVVPLEGGGLLLFFTIEEASGRPAIGLARSADGRSWTVDVGTPVLRRTEGAWDAWGVSAPAVVKTGSVLRLWYVGEATAEGRGPAEVGIGYATSIDGVRWVKSPDNPVLAPSTSPTSFYRERVDHPTVVVSQEGPILFFAGAASERWTLGRATRW